jgi:hypothetical protein
MSQSRNKYDAWREASLAQKVADKYPDFVELSGSDYAISKKIQRLKSYVKLGYAKQEEVEPLLIILNGDRMAAYATNQKSNDITKLGLMLPKAEDIISEF